MSQPSSESGCSSNSSPTQVNGHPEVIVVTGASAGLGRAIVRAFARPGVRIGLIARGTEGLERARAEVEATGGKALVAPADMADPAAVQQAADAIEGAFGPIDIWVNNAMTTVFAPLHQITPDEYKRVTEVTYLGCVYGTQAALKSMRQRNRGVIVQIGSALAYRSIPLQAPYCGAKHAIAGFTDTLRTELLHEKSNIHLSMLQMPALNTPQFEWCRTKLSRQPQPVPPIYQPEVAAAAVVWAARHRRREVYVGMPTWIAIIGNKIAPSLADRYLAWTFESQLMKQPIEPDRPDNLFEPVPGDFGAHGSFGGRTHRSSMQLWMTEHRGWLVLGALGLGALALSRGTSKQNRSGLSLLRKIVR
jgi:short-subunit dehydrogenase